MNDDVNGCKRCGFQTTDRMLEQCPVCRISLVLNLPPVLYPCALCGGAVDTRVAEVAVWIGETVHGTCLDPEKFTSEQVAAAFSAMVEGAP
jgi:hypothetical protein